MVTTTEEEFDKIIIKFMNGKKKGNDAVYERRCRSLFGLDCRLITIVWSSLEEHGILQSISQKDPIHLLMALHFLKSYGIQTQLASIFSVDEKTYRKWTWTYINAIKKLSPFYVSQLQLLLNSIVCIFLLPIYKRDL